MVNDDKFKIMNGRACSRVFARGRVHRCLPSTTTRQQESQDMLETKTCGCRCYNGWANWETWNTVVWLQNDQRLNHIMQMFSDYDHLINHLIHDLDEPANPDGVLWDLPCINRREITEMMNEE